MSGETKRPDYRVKWWIVSLAELALATYFNLAEANLLSSAVLLVSSLHALDVAMDLMRE
jgi:hypothetical protein